MAVFSDINGQLLDINFLPLPDGQEAPDSIFWVPTPKSPIKEPSRITTTADLEEAVVQYRMRRWDPSSFIMILSDLPNRYKETPACPPTKSQQVRNGKQYHTACAFCWAVVCDEHDCQTFTLTQLQRAALAGCSVCDTVQLSITRAAKMLFQSFDPDKVKVQQRQNTPSRLLSDTRLVEARFDEYDRQSFELDFATDCSSTAHVGRRILDTSSDLAIELIQSWISECTRSHASCQTSARATLPRRVVEVGNPRARLVELEGTTAPYLTLSHCWVQTTVTQVTSATLTAMKETIPWHTLTKTFQDAIMITWRLGFRYIWIDGLCILQDSRDDWEYHVTHMAEIFSNTQLTLAASRAANGQEGCYSNRLHEPYTIDFPVERRVYSPAMWQPAQFTGVDRDGVSKTFDVVLRPLHGLTRRERPREPLLKRAWVLQEQILSPRIVHFATLELFYECKSHVACECSGWSLRSMSRQWETRWRKAYSVMMDQGAAEPPLGLAPEQEKARDFEAYKTLVETYTELDITSDLDRLPALSGITAGRRDQYLAGVWRRLLLESLHWFPTAQDLHGCMTSRPQDYCGPSWSWISMKAPIRFCGSTSLTKAFEGKLRATVHDAVCQPEGLDPRGRLSYGYIVLSGPTARAIVSGIGFTERNMLHKILAMDFRSMNHSAYDRRVLGRMEESRACTFASLQQMDQKTGENQCYLDVPLVLARNEPAEVQIGEEVLCLMVSSLLVLVLKPQRNNLPQSHLPSSELVYRRIGVLSLHSNEWEFVQSAKDPPIVIV